MLFEQDHSKELLTPAIFDGGVNPYRTNVPSPDFFLTEYIDAYLPPVKAKANKYDSMNDSNDDFSQHQEDFFSQLDFEDIIDPETYAEFLADPLANGELEIGDWISQSSFPSPIDTSNAAFSNMEDLSPIQSCLSDESTNNADMVVPPSPPLSLTSSAASPGTSRKPKLSPVDRKVRKKNQNKNAAEKYRIKKKSERERLLDRHGHLKSTNHGLKLELENLSYQVQQLKQLFSDVLQIPLPVSK